MGNNIIQMIREEGRRQGLNGAQIRAMIATARQESGLDPNAVGDGGTSFGLFQHHIGGAGGSTRASAQRYLDPLTSIRERAKWFREYDIRGGKGAAALQRPADPSGYAASVDGLLGSSNPGRSSGGGARTGGGGGASRQPVTGSKRMQYLADYLYKDNPVLHSLFSSMGSQASTPSEATGRQSAGTPSRRHTGGALGSYQDLVALAQKHGLQLDPGDAQTTGGSHTAGSLHYSGKAADFGDARNNPQDLRRFASFLANNRKRLGINEVAYNPLGWGIDAGNRIPGMTWGGHDDHLHVGLN